MKRGASGLSMVLGVVKPSGMSSHDVVSRVRRIFGEKRVGHAGTLDPFATGVLPILVGPATRLDKYMTAHDKSYVADIVLGRSTATDDRCGEVLREGRPPAHAFDSSFAEQTLEAFLGASMQMPPAYSAIKVGGRKACDEARKGNLIELKPRPIEVHAAQLLDVCEKEGDLVWRVFFHVSKGTYIRALARDIGKRVGVPAHLAELERRQVGGIGIEDCCALGDLERVGCNASVDPVRLLGMRVLFADEAAAQRIANGGAIDPSGARVFDFRGGDARQGCSCMPSLVESCAPLSDGELLAVVSRNKLAAVYRFDGRKGVLRPDCVFQVEVSRGADIPA